MASRGRLLFQGAPKRFDIFKLLNGRMGTKQIAKRTARKIESVLRDLKKMRDLEIIRAKIDKNGKIIKRNGEQIFEKSPLVKSIPQSYFFDSVKARKNLSTVLVKRKTHGRQYVSISIPDERQILDICRSGEDQLYEFKAAGVEIAKLSKEICAFANTKAGGIIFYGVEDDGSISGTDKRRQQFDQSLRNSIHSTIKPSVIIDLKERDLLGNKILLIIVPPWNEKDIYYHCEKVYIRKGTNVFAATPEEIKKLHNGVPVI